MQTLQNLQFESHDVDFDQGWNSVGIDQMVKSGYLDASLFLVFDRIQQMLRRISTVTQDGGPLLAEGIENGSRCARQQCLNANCRANCFADYRDWPRCQPVSEELLP